MKFRDAMLIPAMLGPLVAGTLMGMGGFGYEYLFLNLIFDGLFGFFEWRSIKRSGKSISQNIAATPDWLFWTIIGTWIAMQGGVAVHWILMR